MTTKIIKSLSAILLLSELYTSTIKHDFLLLFLFPAIICFSLEALFNKKSVFLLAYAFVAVVYNPIYPLTLPLESWTLINSATSILLIIDIFSWCLSIPNCKNELKNGIKEKIKNLVNIQVNDLINKEVEAFISKDSIETLIHSSVDKYSDSLNKKVKSRLEELIDKALLSNSANKSSETERLIKKAVLIWDKEEELNNKTRNTSILAVTETISTYDLEALNILFEQDLKVEGRDTKPTNCSNNNL